MTYDETVVAIFCKAPVPGYVKSRLSVDVGPETAAAVYRCCTEHVVWNVRHSGLDNVVFIDPPETMPAFHDWLGGLMAVQRGDDLGERMQNAVNELLLHRYERVIIVGTDVPFLEPELMHEAAMLLNDVDVVIGPAFDGGYYLIGMNGARPDLFRGITWSTPTVLEQTRAICRLQGWTMAELDPLRDIDTKQDLDAIFREAPPGHDDLLRRCHLALHHVQTH